MTEECITTPHFYKPPNHQTRQSVHAAGGSRPGVFKGDRDTLSRKKSGQTSPAGPRNGMPAATWALSETTPGSEHGPACTLFSQGLRKQAGEPQGLTEFFLAFSFLIRVAVNIQNIKKFLGAQPSLFSYCERALYVDCGRFVPGLGQSLSPAPAALPSGHTRSVYERKEIWHKSARHVPRSLQAIATAPKGSFQRRWDKWMWRRKSGEYSKQPPERKNKATNEKKHISPCGQ